MLVLKRKSIETVLDLEDFLNNRFVRKNAPTESLSRDLTKAKKYYYILEKMRNLSVDFGWFSYFPKIENNNSFIVNTNGIADRETVDFSEINYFSKYLVKEYEI